MTARLILGVATTSVVLALAACAPVDDSIGSQLTQPPPGTEPQKPTEAGDVAIAGQQFAHSVMDLPEVANATTPPMVELKSVTSIVDKPVDTDPYTELLRDRLLLITREKLRFQEHTLPPLVVAPKKGKSKKEAPAAVAVSTDPDYQVLAELRGHFEDDFYKIQIEFVDIHTGQVLFNGLYRIHKEAQASPDPTAPPPAVDPSAPAAVMGTPQ